jgi:hypothetical protein
MREIAPAIVVRLSSFRHIMARYRALAPELSRRRPAHGPRLSRMAAASRLAVRQPPRAGHARAEAAERSDRRARRRATA